MKKSELPKLPSGYSWNARHMEKQGEFYLNRSPIDDEPPEDSQPGSYCAAQFRNTDPIEYCVLGKIDTIGLDDARFEAGKKTVDEPFEELVQRLVILDRMTS